MCPSELQGMRARLSRVVLVKSTRTFRILYGPWLSMVLLFLAFTAFSAEIGFHVWPIGEARNWLWILQSGPGIAAAKVFWGIDARNPLSPWWYMALRPLFEHVPQAFLIMQLAVGVLLGGATYLLVQELSHKKWQLLSCASGIVTSVFVVNHYIDGINWNFVGAVSASVLSIWSYLVSQNSTRNTRVWSAASCFFWLVAISTYTIQSGAVVAIVALHYLKLNEKRFFPRLFSTVLIAVPYVVIYAIFLYLWRLNDIAGITRLPLEPTSGALLSSISQGIWSRDFTEFFAWARQLRPEVVLAFGIVPAAAAYFGLQETESSTLPVVGRIRVLMYLGIVAVSLVLPTILLEASSTTWVPGTRWPMVTQFWTPILFILLVGLLCEVLRAEGAKRVCLLVAVSIFVALSGILTAGMNRLQVAVTHGDQAFFGELREIVKGDVEGGQLFPRHYLIRTHGARNLPSDFVARSYADTVLRGYPTVTYRFNPIGGIPTPITLKDDEALQLSPYYPQVSYDHVAILAWDGKHLRHMHNVSESDLSPDGLVWARSSPLP